MTAAAFLFPAGAGEERVVGAPGAYHDRSTVDQKLYDGGGLRPAEPQHSGHDPTYVQYAAANMTGSNRLLLGLGWPVVTLLALAAAKRLRRGSGRALELDRANRMELGFLLVAGAIAFAIPLTGQIHLVLGVVLLGWFA